MGGILVSGVPSEQQAEASKSGSGEVRAAHSSGPAPFKSVSQMAYSPEAAPEADPSAAIRTEPLPEKLREGMVARPSLVWTTS